MCTKLKFIENPIRREIQPDCLTQVHASLKQLADPVKRLRQPGKAIQEDQRQLKRLDQIEDNGDERLRRGYEYSI
jgi:hypothetical protein